MGKFKKEKYIAQRQSKLTGLWTFQVRVPRDDGDLIASFSEEEFGLKAAWKKAILCRDDFLANKGKYPKKRQETFEDIYQETIRLHSEWAPETIRDKDIKYRKLPIELKCKKIQDITPFDVQMALNQNTDASFDTMKRMYTLCVQIFDTARKKKIITEDIMFSVDKPMRKKVHSKTRIKQVSKEDVMKVIEYLEGDSHALDPCAAYLSSCAIKICYSTGIRPAECLALQKKSIDFKKKIIHITNAISLDQDRHATIGSTKTESSYRDLPLNSFVEPVLRALVKRSKSGRLFDNDKGNLVDTKQIDHIIARACKACDVKFTLYTLRNQFSTDLVRSGIDIKTTQALMGHENIDMTVFYAQTDMEEKKKAIVDRRLS